MVRKARARNRPFDDKLCDDKRFDAEYTGWLRDLTKGESFESRKKGRETDDHENEYVDDEDTDSDFENVLRCLKECGNSYILEDERDGLLTIVKYEEEDTSSENDRDPEPRRKLRSASKKEKESSDRSKGVEIKSTNGSKSDPVKNTRVLSGRNSKDTDGSSSDVEIIDSVTFHKKENSNPSQMNKDGCKNRGVEVEFRRQVIANLKRPYDQNEYDMLWEDINFCKPKLHHKELRNGRELSYLTDTEGKSYLQHYPEFKRELDRFHDDKLKCLNLLRGFFFWLKNKVHDGSFKPWLDRECLSLNPGSC